MVPSVIAGGAPIFLGGSTGKSKSYISSNLKKITVVFPHQADIKMSENFSTVFNGLVSIKIKKGVQIA